MELNPLTAVWEYTLRCNSRCIHCGSDAKDPRDNELNREESLDLVRQLTEVGFKRIVLSGGEPTMRRDWIDISRDIRKRGLELGVISNALAWDSSTIREIHSLEPYAVGFSVDGERELHDYLRGVRGSHEKVFKVIKELKRMGSTVCVITSVNSKNLEELGVIRNRLIIYGVDAWQIQVTSPMGRMVSNKKLILNKDEYYRLGEFIAETRENVPYMNVQAGDCIGYMGALGKKVRDGEWKGCMAGIEVIGIESNGNIKGCLSMMSEKAIEGNIRETPLESIWRNPTKFIYNRSFASSMLGESCKGCEYWAKCRGGCVSQSLAFSGEFHNAPYCFTRDGSERQENDH